MMKKTLMRLAIWSACLAVLAVATTGQAATILGASVSLEDLITNNGTVTAGDKEFSDFSYAYTGDMPDAAGVNVIPIIDLDGNYGLRFQGAFLDTTFSAGGSDALIGYNVTVTDPNMLITEAIIQGNTRILDRNGTGQGEISVVDTFLPLDTTGMYTMDIQDKKSLTEDITRLVDSTQFTKGYSFLPVQKDILAFAFTNSATASFIDQTYKQSPVPEPHTLGLLGLVGLGLAVGRRRQS